MRINRDGGDRWLQPSKNPNEYKTDNRNQQKKEIKRKNGTLKRAMTLAES
jgi:hypothetical protein